MACRYYTDYELKQQAQEAKAKAFQELDRVTRMLCEVCTQLEQNAPRTLAEVPGLADWLEEHKVLDQQRRAAEAEKAADEQARKAWRAAQAKDVPRGWRS